MIYDSNARPVELYFTWKSVKSSVPASTGAAIAINKALPAFEGKFDGVAIRTSSAIGSISDITFIAERNITPAEINFILEEESKTERYQKVMAVTSETVNFRRTKTKKKRR